MLFNAFVKLVRYSFKKQCKKRIQIINEYSLVATNSKDLHSLVIKSVNNNDNLEIPRAKKVRNVKCNTGPACAEAILISVIYVNSLPFIPNYHASKLNYVYH